MAQIFCHFFHASKESFLWQCGLVLLAAALSYGVARPVLIPFLRRLKGRRRLASVLSFLSPVLVYGVFMVSLLFCACISWWFFRDTKIIFLALQLSFFFVVSHYVYLFSSSVFLSIFVGLFLSGVWVLKKLKILAPIHHDLSQYSFSLGTFKISPDEIVRGILTALFLFWVTSFVTSLGEKYIKKSKRLDTGTKEIAVKLFEVGVYFFALVIGLNVVGVNLTTLNVIGGALGVGVGFGLQKVTSNFISGLILLFERTIKVGDLIELGTDVFGVVKQLSARYVLVEASNGKDILIPNEDLITHRVVNWTLTNNFAKVEIPVQVAYSSDLNLVQELMIEAAKQHPRTLMKSEPVCFIREFGDYGIRLLLVFFVEDVIAGVMRPQSDVMMAILEKFKAHNIEISFPRQTVVVKNNV